MATWLPIDALDLRDVPHVVDVSSKVEAEDLLAGRPYGTFCVWRLHKFVILTYQDPGCKELAHSVIEKSHEGLFRIRNNSKQAGFRTLRELIASRKYLNADLPIDDINIMTGDGVDPPAGGATTQEEAKESRRARMPLRLRPSGIRKNYAEEERMRMVSELWEEPKALPPYTNATWGKALWWACFVTAAAAALFAAAFMAPYVLHKESASAAMKALHAHAAQELEETVGHIGEEGQAWGTDGQACEAELTAWRGRVEGLESELMHKFDESAVSDALRHTVFSVLLAWACIVLHFTAGTPHGKLEYMRVPSYIARTLAWVVAAAATVVSFQYMTMCSEVTQLLHEIPLWLRDVRAETDECRLALLSTTEWLHTEPTHVWLHLPFGLPMAPVPATRDVPLVVMTFGVIVTVASLAGFCARYYTHQYLHAKAAASSKKQR